MFCKLYMRDEKQFLLKIDQSDDDGMEAEIRIYFEPEGLGVCSSALHFADVEVAQERFDRFTEAEALKWADKVLVAISGMNLTTQPQRAEAGESK